MTYTYAQAIATLQAQGYPVDAGGVWGPISQNSWWMYLRSAAYTSGIPIELAEADYAFAYQGVVDSNFGTGVASGSGYIAKANAAPASVAIGSYASFNVRESGGQATAFNWNYGDSNTGTGNPATHAYAAAGTYKPYVSCTVGGNPVGPFYAQPITVR